MKRMIGITLFAFAMLLASSAFAGDKTVTLSGTTTVGGQKLTAGEYKVRVEGTGSTAQLHFFKGKKEVASASAEMAELDYPVKRDGVVLASNGDGSSKLVEIQFAGQKSAIRLNGSESASGN